MKEYLSINEWADAYAAGLKASLHGSFSEEFGELHHIEDLMASTAVYADNIYEFIAMMPRSGFSYREYQEKAHERAKIKDGFYATMGELREKMQKMNDDLEDREAWNQAIADGRLNPHAFHIKWNEPSVNCHACNVKE